MSKTMKLIIGLAVVVVALAFIANSPIFAKVSQSKQASSLAKPSESMYDQFDGNTIACWMENTGLIVSQNVTGSSGLEWPKGSTKTIDYASGLWLFGKTPSGEILSASSEYATEFQPGPILADGTAGDPDDPAYRIYKINSDGSGDWDVWPYDQGAPYVLDGSGNKVPQLIGDQTMFWVMNDAELANHGNFMSTNPMNIEQQVVVFGYNTADPLGNMMFVKWITINKSAVDYTECYVGIWDDPDLGNAADDLVGCDTTLSLGYCYNGGPVDATYGTTPPAIGFDFFQGPMVDGQPLPMTGFVYYWNGAPDPYGDPEDVTQGYYFMKGFASDGSSYVSSDGVSSRFVNSGDPVTKSGWLDSAPQDRRYLMSSGPFTLAARDTQVIVGAKIIAPGVDNLSSVSALRFFDTFAQIAFDNNFNMPVPPAPIVEVVNLDGELVLTWQDDLQKKYQTIEAFDYKGYKFEGYNIYQGQSSTGPWKLIKTLDLVNELGIVFDNTYDATSGMVLFKPLAFGSNAGVSREITISSDAIGGLPLRNFKNYYFAVTAYAVNPDVSPKVVESGQISVLAVPSGAPLGVEYNADAGTVINAAHTAGVSNGIVQAVVVDPSALKNHVYQVTFQEVGGQIVWQLNDKTAGYALASSQTNQVITTEDFPIADGLKVKVGGAPLAFAGNGNGIVEVAYAGTPLTDAQFDAAGRPYGGNTVWHGLNRSGVPRYYISANGNGGIDRLMRFIQFAVPRDFELRFTEAGGWAVFGLSDDKIAKVPFEIWDIGIATPNDPSDDVRMIPFLLENVETSDHWGWNTGTEATFGAPMSDPIYWMDADGVDGYSKFAAVCEATGAGNTYPYATDGSAQGYYIEFHGGTVYPIGRQVVCDYSEAGTPPPAGTTIRFNTTKPNAIDDVFEFTAPIASVGTAVARAQIENINAVPNPYFGYNPAERTPTTRLMRFTNLPLSGAFIRIFDLAGNLVQVIDDAARSAQGSLNTTYAEWNLRNSSDIPVSSGMYLVYVDVPNVGNKVLKVAVINRDERLIYF